jgi:hypothetical protein
LADLGLSPGRQQSTKSAKQLEFEKMLEQNRGDVAPPRRDGQLGSFPTSTFLFVFCFVFRPSFVGLSVARHAASPPRCLMILFRGLALDRLALGGPTFRDPH